VALGYKVVESDPKTEKSRRAIGLDPTTIGVLRALRSRQRSEHLAWGTPWSISTPVLTKEDGTPYHPQYLTWAWQRAARLAGVPVLPLHSARHSHATAGLRAGVDLHTMSRRLGHSSVSVTGDVYSHVVQELDHDAAERIAGVVLASTGGAAS
jgi:integrase